MESLPSVQSSLAFRSLYLSNSSSEVRLENPTITPLFEEATNISGESKVLDFEIEMKQKTPEAIIYGYTTLGSFSSNDLVYNILDFDRGTASLQWFSAESDQGEGELIAIVEDGLGGISYWMGTGTINNADETIKE